MKLIIRISFVYLSFQNILMKKIFFLLLLPKAKEEIYF